MPTICRGLKPATANYSFQSHPITDGSNIHPLTWRVIFFLLNDAVENCTLSKDREQQKLSKHVPGDIISFERYKDTPSRLRETWCWMYHVCVCVCVCVCSLLSCVQLFVTPWTIAHQAPLSGGFSRQEYSSRLPFLSGDLPNSEIEPRSPALQVDSLPTEPPEKT